MIGVRTGFGNNVNRLIHGDATLCQQPDQFRDNHGRMSIVDLDNSIVIEVMEVGASLHTLVQNQLRTAAYHEILLINTELSAFLIRIIRVEEQGQVLRNVGFVKGDAILDDGFIYSVHIKEMEFISSVFIAGYINVIHPGLEGQITKGNRIGHSGGSEPVLLFHPGIRCFFLQFFFKFLFEQSQMVVETNTVTG